MNPGNGKLRENLKKMACHIARVSAVEFFVTCSYEYKKFAWIKNELDKLWKKIIGWIWRWVQNH